MAQNQKDQKVVVQEAAETAVETVAKNLPQELFCRISGTKNDITLDARNSVLSPDQKLDRDAIFRIGRLVEEPEMVEFISGGKTVISMIRGEKNWTAQIEGRADALTIERSTTTRPGKDNKQLDAGPDLFKAVTAAAKVVWPDLSSRSGGGGATPATRKLRKELSAKEEQLNKVLKALKDMGVDVDAILGNDEEDGEDGQE